MEAPASPNKDLQKAAYPDPNAATSMLNPYIYDASSLLPDRLSQPNPETASERMARLTKAVDTSLAALDRKEGKVE